MNGKSAHGAGSITHDKRSGRWRLRIRIDDKDRSLDFDSREDARLARRVHAESLNTSVGITLREWGEIWFDEHDFGNSTPATWRSIVLRSAPFIDYPLVDLTSEDIAAWASILPTVKRTRRELRDGKRKLVTLDEPISRAYAGQALSLVRSCLDAANNRSPQLISSNPAAEVELPSPRNKATGRIRTKAVKRSRTRIDALPQSDCDRIFYCTDCEAASGIPRHDLDQLVHCEHLPFMYRVALSCSILQGLRKGEIASQRWERISVAGAPEHDWAEVAWANQSDWSGQVWLVAESWGDDTKNGQDRVQPLIPMAARLLHRWWIAKERPSTGLIFSAVDSMPSGQPLGELARFVARFPKHTNRDLLAEAERAAVPLTLRRIETLRSEARKHSARKTTLANKMFARGYDFGWTDTPYRDNDGVLQVRPGWVTKLGIERRRRFHDFRDTAASHLLSGSWGARWSLADVSEFIGHSDVKVTRDRYAALLTEEKVRLAAGVQPCRLTETERSAPRDPSEVSGRKVAVNFSMTPELTTENAWAPQQLLKQELSTLRSRGCRRRCKEEHFREVGAK